MVGPTRSWHFAVFALLAPVSAWAREIVVDPKGPIPTITQALHLARAGDRILVRAGRYREPTLLVDRRVEIVGEGWPVVDAGGDHEAIRVTADSVVIRGLVIQGVGPSTTDDRAGIKLIEVHGCTIEGNRLRQTFFGIYLAKSSGCRIAGNRIQGNGLTEVLSGNAIHLWSSNGVTIEGNQLSGHRDGIYLEFTDHSIIRQNRSTGNLRYGVHFMFSHDCEYLDNTFADNGAGVAVMYSHGVVMTGNRFEHSWGGAAYGLLLKDITDSRVSGNLFGDNSVGLYAEGTNRVAVSGNRFERNGWALKIMADAQDNRFEDNVFLGNSFDVTTNGTSNSSRFERNYWDHYTGYDLDGDGIGDVPFHPVRLFALLVQQNEPALILLRSSFVDLLDLAERVLPVLTPETLVDRSPRMRPPHA